MTELALNINLALDTKNISVPLNTATTAEDVCIFVCKALGIGTIARHLFALRISGKNFFLCPADTFDQKNLSFDFRVRFKPALLDKLKKCDIKAYDYYFYQVRQDVLENKIADIEFEKCKKELVGLGITDMYRDMVEKNLRKDTVENDYKKYIPKEVLKRHSFFIKKPIRDTLEKLQKTKHDVGYIKEEYLKQLELISPEYLAEVYKAITDQNGSTLIINIKVLPCNTTSESGLPVIKYAYESNKDEWLLLCTIEEIAVVSIRNDGTIEISRKNGIPFYLKFGNILLMKSFIAHIDGYYRLSCKWIFNICRDVITPSLKKLYEMRSHGPVGGEFSYGKLAEKRSNHPGCFVIRESDSKYNHYFIDLCVQNSPKPKTFKLEKITNEEFIFNDDLTRYKTIGQLISAYRDSSNAIYLKECLPPSEYDKSPLLLCQRNELSGSSLVDKSTLSSLLSTLPLIIDHKSLQVFKLHGKFGLRKPNLTVLYKGLWKINKSKKIEVAMKVLENTAREKYFQLFLDIAGTWAYLQSPFIARIYGATLCGNISIVMEYFHLGPLHRYLQTHKDKLQTVDLIEASGNLASALWYLAENRIVHGNIRCRKLMVNLHNKDCFNVKLTDPGIFRPYEASEVHWIPPECHVNAALAKTSFEADVWAFSTTVWQIFLLGSDIPYEDHAKAQELYNLKHILPRPPSCPDNIYKLMRECWDFDPHKRKKPQAVMRDINQILYQVYNSRKSHSYSEINSKSSTSNYHTADGGLASVCSGMTESTTVLSSHELSLADLEGSDESKHCTNYSQNLLIPSEDTVSLNSESFEFSNIFSNCNFSTNGASLESLNSWQNIYELDDNTNIVQLENIGQGFYGEVYKGLLENRHDAKLWRHVAIKKLKSTTGSVLRQDFEREINIMKNLSHPNIVEIVAVQREPEIALIMEFIEHGSLQSYLKIHKESLQSRQLLGYALDIAEGMRYLGTRNIIHRDLAARNILVANNNHVKISDFGLAQKLDTNDYYMWRTNREVPIKWYAPECLKYGKFSTRSDVWSFGVTMCETFNYGEEPVLPSFDKVKKDDTEGRFLVEALEKGERFPCPPYCEQAVYVRIIYPCWNDDTRKRPTFESLKTEIEDLITQY